MRYLVFGPLRYADFWGFAVRDSNGGGGGGFGHVEWIQLF